MIFHLVLFLLGVAGIWLYADGMLWQSVYMVLLVFGIPGVTYFAQTSLRRARSKVIDPGEDIHISVRNLVKIYDWGGILQNIRRFIYFTRLFSPKR